METADEQHIKPIYYACGEIAATHPGGLSCKVSRSTAVSFSIYRPIYRFLEELVKLPLHHPPSHDSRRNHEQT